MSNQVSESRSRTDAMLRTAFGSVICDALVDPAIVEIMQTPMGRSGLNVAEKAGNARARLLRQIKLNALFGLSRAYQVLMPRESSPS